MFFFPEIMDSLQATILVLVVTSERMLLAADSRNTHIETSGLGRKEAIDKIGQTGDYYYAVSGLNSSADGSFSIPVILQRVLATQPDLKKAEEALAHTLANEIKHFLEELKGTSPETFRHLLHYCSSGGEIFVVSKYGPVPSALLLDYRITDGTPLKVVLNTWSITLDKIEQADDCYWRAIGNVGFLKEAMPGKKEVAADPEGMIRRIMEEGIRRSPEFVGPPVHLLELSRDGARWIELF
jgi:hypothetical protein